MNLVDALTKKTFICGGKVVVSCTDAVDAVMAADKLVADTKEELNREQNEHALLQARCYEGFPSFSDGVFAALHAADQKIVELTQELKIANESREACRQSALMLEQQISVYGALDMYAQIEGLTKRAEQMEKTYKLLVEALNIAKKELVHDVPGYCYATGPMTGDMMADLVICPGCAAIKQIDEALKAAGEL